MVTVGQLIARNKTGVATEVAFGAVVSFRAAG